jgi:hypothetical protein
MYTNAFMQIWQNFYVDVDVCVHVDVLGHVDVVALQQVHIHFYAEVNVHATPPPPIHKHPLLWVTKWFMLPLSEIKCSCPRLGDLYVCASRFGNGRSCRFSGSVR